MRLHLADRRCYIVPRIRILIDLALAHSPPPIFEKTNVNRVSVRNTLWSEDDGDSDRETD